MTQRSAHRAILALFAIALAGGAQAASIGAGPDCTVTRQSALPLLESHGRFVTPVRLNDAERMMLIDSGAQRAALSPQTAAELQLPTDPQALFRTHGVGGASAGEHPSRLRSIAFGAQVWPEYDVQTVNIVRPDQAADPSAPVGLIGGDMLSNHDVELDFPNNTLTLYAVSGCGSQFAPWSGRFDTLKAQAGPRNLFIIQAELDGRPIRALVDTGANTSSLSRSAARAAGVDAETLKQGTAGSYVGAKGVAVAAYRHRFDSLTIGGVTLNHVQLAVQDQDFGPFDMLLGMDYLRSHKVWLSYRTHEVFIQSAREVASAAP